MRGVEDLTTSWHRLWLQVGDPAFTVEPRLMRSELAQLWAQIDALTQLGQGVEPVARVLELQLCALAVRSLADPGTFDDGHWQQAQVRADAAVGGPVPAVELPDLLPGGSEPQDLLAEIVARVSPGRSGVIEPVLDAGLRVERSRPGWLLNGLTSPSVLSQDATHLGVFAIDEGDNEVLAIMRVDQVAPHVELSEDDVITGLHERARLDDRLTVAALIDVVASFGTPSDDAGRLELALARASVRAALDSLEQLALTTRARAVSSAVVYVVAVLGRGDQRLDLNWHVTRLIALL